MATGRLRLGKWGRQKTKGKQQKAGEESSMHLVLPGEGCLHSTCQAQQWYSQPLILILVLQICQLPAQLGCLFTMASHGSDMRCNNKRAKSVPGGNA